ncbi:hypothetical protein MSSIT_3889 [Methanosarcina siciliae T4/M]|uniref:DUF1673 family protein n=1 Tax=Methanosarcina siciliae T4/M TaxID=1434120 RepID=A0A0E3P995_9EURY|nr:DUF1673 family protein [Methanosarcina siciliae]AKB30608.1 hypothetical protein MSSIT_3889 [Methanosarcina siciliae T4/M]
MPAKAAAFEQIKKLMGWCPVCGKMAPQRRQLCSFVNTTPVSGKTGNLPELRTSNVLFPANTTLFLIYFMISFRLLLSLKYPEEILFFLTGIFLFNISFYFLILKTFDTAVLVNKLGVHLQAFRLKKFEIPYEEVESITLYRLEKRSKKASLLLGIGGIAICGFVAYIAVGKGDWNVPILLISLLPLLLFAERKQRTQFRDLNTQLYIKTRHKKWYEWTPYYSLVTDEASAEELKSSIERHCEGI